MAKKLVLCLLALLLLAGCAGIDNQDLAAMLALADRRAPVARMQPFLHHENRQVRKKAIFLLGQMQDSLAIPLLLPFLQSPSNDIRVETIFALGQVGNAAVAGRLIGHWQREKDLEAKQAILEAVGKTGDASAVDFVVEKLGVTTPILQGDAALALGQMAYRGLALPPLAKALAPLFDDELNELRWRAAWAAMRAKDTTTYRLLYRASRDTDPRVRMQCARAFGRLGLPAAGQRLQELAKKDGDWRVRATAAAALGELSASGGPEILPLDDENEHVCLAALGALARIVQHKTRGRDASAQAALTALIERKLSPPAGMQTSWRERAAAVALDAAANGPQALERLRNLKADPNAHFRARLAAAIGKIDAPGTANDLLALYHAGPLRVKVAVLEALGNRRGRVAQQIALSALKEKDPVLTALACTYFAREPTFGVRFARQLLAGCEALPRPYDPETAQMIFRALAKLGMHSAAPLLEKALQQENRGVQKAAADALAQLTGQPVQAPESAPPDTAGTLDLQALKRLRTATATIVTEKGSITLAFYPDESPFTVLNFVRLAASGFYDGLEFHRVVPNFVVQAGDPRGDGWGTPGYTIRSEFNRHRYIRGSVGMASAGPDTEGSQFFITHSPQPHLNGKYTLFARVQRGMEVVDAIQAGDRIFRIDVRKR